MTNQLEQQFQMQQSNTGTGVMANTMASREMEEVKGQIFLAKQFPRNVFDSQKRILDQCKRESLAKTAIYSYPRGGQNVSGPSIRLAEVIAQNYGNITAGVRELEQRDGESVAQAYAWDMETNTRIEKTFTVPHIRYTRNGTKKLEDPRDIYELVANNGARRLRACILSVIPGDVVEEAINECNKTLSGNNKTPLKDRLARALNAFKEDYSVTQEMIETKYGYDISQFSEKNFVDLTQTFNALKDGMAKVEDAFNTNVKSENKETADKTNLEKDFQVGSKVESKQDKKVVTEDEPKQEELL